ncbi:hypothetical protein QCN29_17385 [Streptomyces sp. HNM0663]|uniref:Uncharacterized protein n=1 Tax=Streptomyces chengmaiensis TaxID=3040919 RepID=A0ABT6HP87_9ACTN|nr:hypothetical protein [Streptomyces chengmaiensis]MDH2390532.1 hypothetical protein [Streptomyces chengmaiensis]
MSLISALARLEAVEAGRAQPLATVRHRHLSERPLVLVPLTTAGEAGAPLGALVGSDPEEPRLLAVPQPRDRDLRSAFLAQLADAVLPHLESYADDVEPAERKETDPETGKRVTVQTELCADAPQLIVPSRAGVEYVRLLGRSMRFRRTAEQDPDAPYPAPPRVPLLGRWLTHYGERARVPGSSLLLAATDLLNRHWATGQSNLEDQHLGALLAWVDPPEAESGAEAALRAELARDSGGQLLCPPAGPATDPAFDNRLLAPAMERYDRARMALATAEDGAAADMRLGELTRAEREIRELLASQLRPTWRAVWRCIELLRELPEGPRADGRWTRDRWSFTGHRDRVRAGEPPQPRRDDAVTAAQKLATRETAQAQLDAQEALDDPLVMAGRRLAGEAFASEVTDVVMAWSESKRPSPRPLVTVRTNDRPHLGGDGGPGGDGDAADDGAGDGSSVGGNSAGRGTKVFRVLADGKSQTAEFVGREADGSLVLRLTDRMGRSKEPAEGSVPDKGDRIVWTLFEHEQRGGPKLPDPEETPWTHGGPPTTEPELPDVVTVEDVL